MRRWALAAVVTAATLGSLAPAALAIGWTTPVSLAPSASPGTPGNPVSAENARLAVNAAGAQAIVWDDMEDTGDGTTCVTGEARTRIPGGDWSPTTDIGCDAQVTIGPDGTALALWDDPSGLQAASAAAGSSFGAAQQVDVPDSYSSVAATIDYSGRATVAFHIYRPVPGSQQYDVAAKTQNPDGTWPAARQVVDIGGTFSSTAVSSTYGLVVAAGAHGDVVIASDIALPPSAGAEAGKKGIVTFTRLTPAGAWVKRTLLAPDANNYPTIPVIAADPQDRFTVMDAVEVNAAYQLYAWTRQADTDTWVATPQVVPNAPTTTDYPMPALALDSAGNAQTAFPFGFGTGLYSVRTATRAAGSTDWIGADPDDLGPSPCTTNSFRPEPSITFDIVDTATISFDCSTGPLMFTRAAGSTDFAPFAAPFGAQRVQLATDPNGYLIATWTANGLTYTSVYDAVAPSVDALTPPANPIENQPASFTITGSDVWGPVTYSVDFGDGSPPATGRAVARSAGGLVARATAGGAVSHTYSSAGAYTATVTVTDNAANTATSSVPVAVAAASVPGPVELPPVVVPGLPDPVAGVSANVAPVKPVVRVKAPGTKAFVPLTAPAQIKIGSVIDARKGRVRITIANGLGKLDTADFYEGVFKLTQPKAKARQRWFANLYLQGGRFKGCPTAPRRPRIARKRQKGASVRHLWGSGEGAFRTVGRFSSATIRGTTWLTDDLCNGTLTRVTTGKVGVRDFVKKRTIVVKAPKRYLARPAKKR